MPLSSLLGLFARGFGHNTNTKISDLPDWRFALDFEQQLASKDIAGALKKLPQLLGADVENPETLAVVASSFAVHGQFKAARKLLSRMDKLGPVSEHFRLRFLNKPSGIGSIPTLSDRDLGEIARCWLAYGDRLIGLEMWAPARSLLEAADEIAKPNPARRLTQLVRCDQALNEPETARQRLETLQKSLANSDRAHDHLLLARGYLAIKDWAKAIAAARRGCELDPADPALWLELVRGQLWGRNARGARRACGQLLALNPKLKGHDIQLVFRTAIAAGDHALMQTSLQAIKASEGWDALHGALLSMLLARGDSCAAVELLKSDDKLAQTRLPKELVRILHDAGVSRSDALDLLGRWAPSQAADLVGPTYCAPLQNLGAPDQTFNPQDIVNRRELPNWQDWCRKSRGLLAAYLVQRDYQRFDALVQVAITYLTRRQIEKLHRHAELRYPQSRLFLQLGYLLEKETVSAETPEVCRATLWRNEVSEPDHPVCEAARGFGQVPLLCTAMVRDENALLPDFFKHYAALGVRHFLILDNLSEDRPDHIATDFPDLDIRFLRIRDSYAATFFGMAWINAVLGATQATWHLFVDVDEFLVFAGSERFTLGDLIGQLNLEGADAFGVDMVDVYDQNYADGALPDADRSRHDLFLADRRIANTMFSIGRRIYGGVRKYPIQCKVPLLRVGAGIRYLSHFTTPARFSASGGALLHYKIWRDRDLLTMSAEEIAAQHRIKDRNTWGIERHQHFGTTRLIAAEEAAFHLTANTRNLSRMGYIRASADWQAFIGQRLDRNRADDGLQASQHIARMNILPGFAAQTSLAQVLDALETPKVRGDRALSRRLITGTLARIGPRWIALGFLCAAALALNRPVAAGRLFASFRAQLPKIMHHSDRQSLKLIAAGIARHRPLLGLLLHEHLAAIADPDIAPFAVLLLRTGNWDRLDKLIGQYGHERLTLPAFRLFQVRRNWPAFCDVLDQHMKTRPGPTPSLLHQINSIPDTGKRREFQARLLAQIAADGPDRGASRQVLIALAALQERTEDFLGLLEEHRSKLPKDAATYFLRLADHRLRGTVWPTVWAVGLSKTGTSSLHGFGQLAGLLCAHWFNPFLCRLVDREDMDVFDLVSDVTVTYFARIGGVAPSRRVISTERSFESWRKSFLNHYSIVRGFKNPTFNDLRAANRDGVPNMFDPLNGAIHHEAYFQFETLEEAYEYHRDWVIGLQDRMGDNVLRLPLEAPDKSGLLGAFLGLTGTLPDYPHANLSSLR